MNLTLRALIVVALLTAPLLAEQAPQEPADMKKMFNGQDLKGWDGDPKLWTVKDGVIRGETTPENKAAGNTFLIYKGDGDKPAVFSDFELRLSFRCNATNNSGIQYRSKHITEGNPRNKWIVRGYQHEIRNENKIPNVSGFIYDEGGKRGRLLTVGQKVEWKDGKANVLGQVCTEEEFKKAMKLDEWNDVVIIAKGNTIKHYLNGVQIIDFTDSDPQLALKEGIIAVQLHAGNPMWVEFKELRIKEIK